MANRNRWLAASALVMVLTLGSRLLGMVREVAMARYFGATAVTDAYLVASGVPLSLFIMILSTVGSAFVPVYTERRARSEEEGWRFVNNILTILTLVAGLIALLAFVFSGPLVHLLAPGFSEETAALTVRLTRIMLPGLVGLAAACVPGALLQVRGDFLSPNSVGIAQNGLIVCAILLFASHYGVTALAVGTVIGMYLQLFVQLPGLYRQGLRFRPQISLGDEGTRRFLSLLGPVFLGTAAGQIGALVDRIMASNLSEGSISALNYANRLYWLPLGVLGGALVSVLYPSLAGLAANKDGEGFRKHLVNGLNWLTIILAPTMAICAVAPGSLVTIVYGRGAFTAHDVASTAGALVMFAVGMLASAHSDLLQKAFYSLQDTKTPMAVGVLRIVFNIAFNFPLIYFLGHRGLALSLSGSTFLAMLVLFQRVQRRLTVSISGKVAATTARIALAAAAMGGVLWLLQRSAPDLSGWRGMLVFLIHITVSLAVYGTALFVLRVAEFRDMTGALLRRVGHRPIGVRHRGPDVAGLSGDKPRLLVHIFTVPESLQFIAGQPRFLRPFGFATCVVASPGDRLVEFGRQEGVEAFAVPMARKITPVRDLVALARLWWLLVRLRPDIVHAHTPKGGLLGMIAAWLAGVPVRIYHMHGLPYVTATKWKRRLLQSTERLSCLFAHQVLCVSHSIATLAVADRICAREKIAVLLGGSSNGVDAAERFHVARLDPGTRNAVRQTYGISAGAVLLGYVGRIVKDKGIRELADAWQILRDRFPELSLMLVGIFEETDPLPPETVARLKADPRVILTGPCRDMPPMYAALDILVLPTYREGLPNVCLEAGAMELPVVATAVPGCVDVIKPGVNGALVPPYDPDALAEAISTYVRRPELRAAHGRAGRERVLTDFRREAIWSALHSLYESALKPQDDQAQPQVSGQGGNKS